MHRQTNPCQRTTFRTSCLMRGAGKLPLTVVLVEHQGGLTTVLATATELTWRPAALTASTATRLIHVNFSGRLMWPSRAGHTRHDRRYVGRRRVAGAVAKVVGNPDFPALERRAGDHAMVSHPTPARADEADGLASTAGLIRSRTACARRCAASSR